ncbi:MAG TPA: hypothetical protein VH575_21705 [Gemmataceae bacterium]|jgi:hypothetical protein
MPGTNIGKFSRRRLLGGFVAGLASLLCPRSCRPIAAPRQPATAAALRPSKLGPVTIYTYDGRGHLINVTEHPPRPIGPPARARPMPQQMTAFTSYD